MNLAPIFLALFMLLPSCALAGNAPFAVLKGRANTMNFLVLAPNDKDAGMVADSLEEYYKRFLSDLECGSMLKKKPRVYIFENYSDYLDKAGALGYNVKDTGGIAIPRSARKPAEIYSFLSDNLLARTLPHELTHLLFREITTGLKTNAYIPLWLDEGIAVYEERSKSYRDIVKEALARGMLIPAGEITSYSAYPRDLNKNCLFYAESASIVEFLLVEYGGAKFISFSRKMVFGKKQIDGALFSTYYPHIKNISQLNDAWLKFLKK